MQKTCITGTYFDGETSTKSEVSLFYADDGRVGIEGSHRQPVLVTALQISTRIGNTARYIEFPNGGQFETMDNDAVDQLCQQLGYKDRLGFIHTLESHKRFVLATLVVVVLFTWGFVQYGIPAMSRQLAMMMPDEASQYMGQGVLDVLDKRWLEPTKLSAARQAELRRLFTVYAGDAQESLALKLEFRQGGPMQANAFALPDGTIVFTDEFIELADDDLQIGAVMLHEIGHVHHRHSLRAAIQQFGLAMLVMVVTGDVSTSSSVITALPVFLVQTGYSRDMEREADGYALLYMQQHGIDPEHFANIMDRLDARYSDAYETCISAKKAADACLDSALLDAREQDEAGDFVENYFSTHPMSKDRAARFRRSRSAPE